MQHGFSDMIIFLVGVVSFYFFCVLLIVSAFLSLISVLSYVKI